MTAMTATAARQDLFGLIRRVNEDRQPVEIVSKHGNAVLVSAEEYEALEETAHLLSTRANAERLSRALTAIDRGEWTERELVEP
ncbi:MAG: type II toxin-antitoxin system prevent-host-death family antitoxin [Propionibacteriaceae bacterium]|nr:type II toxin-antitoxin system prevent-host-death family antitoxin [Propionibacteriaceae bacterium]